MKKNQFLVFSANEENTNLCRTLSGRLTHPASATFVTEVPQALDTLQGKGISSVVVDYSSLEASESVLFFQKMRQTRGHSFTPLVVIAEEITPELMSLGSEYVFFRIVGSEQRSERLKTALDAVLQELSKPSGLRSAFQKLSHAQRMGHFGEADRILEDCYQLYPDNPDVLVEYGNLCLRKGKLDLAERIATRLAKSGQESLRVSNFAARVRLKQGNFGGALTLLDRANVLSPKNLERLILMGDVLRVQGDAVQAEEKYKEALSLEPENRLGRKGMGLSALSQGEADRALEFFTGAFTEEETGSFFNNTAVLAVRRHHFDKAKKLYSAASSAIEDRKLKAKVVFNMGLMYRRWSKPSEAVEKFREAHQLDPSYEKAERHLEQMGAAATSPQLASERSTALAADSADPLSTLSGMSPSGPELSPPDPSSVDFADSILDGSNPMTHETPLEAERPGSGIRTIEEPIADIKPFSVAALTSRSKAPPPKRRSAAQSGGIKKQEPSQASSMKKASGSESAFIDEDEDDDDVF